MKIVFVCLGNICRSPMAEGLFRSMVQAAGLTEAITIDSAATSRWEAGNPVHPGTQAILADLGIDYRSLRSRPLGTLDWDADYLIGMDSTNIRDIQTLMQGQSQAQVLKLLWFAGSQDDIEDPYYTGDFQRTYRDVLRGCQGLLDYLLEENPYFQPLLTQGRVRKG